MPDRQDLKLSLKGLDKTRVIQGEETAALEALFIQILDTFTAEGREPDEWEATCLHAALEALRKHRPGMARTNLLHALETTRHHEPSHRPETDLAGLRAGLETLMAQAARHPHPHHRPVHQPHHG